MPVSVGELLAYLRLDSSGFDRGIRVAQTEMRTATGTADRMGAAVGVTGERLTGAGRAANVAASGSAKYRAAQLSLVAAQERYNAVLNQGKASTARLASAEAAVIRANERVASSGRAATTAVASLSAAQERGNAVAATTPALMTRTATGFAGAARSAVGLGAAFGAFELARKAIDIGKDASKFQQSMLLIQTNANASASEVSAMTAAVLKLSPEVATKPLDLANALYHVEQNGLRGQKALEALRAGAEGAKIGLADVEDTTNTMTIAVASGISGMGNLQKAMGTMIAIAGTGDMHLKDLNEAISGGILAVAKGYGASLQDVAAVLATLGDNGMRGADAATQLRMVLMGFAAPAAKGKAALDAIGLSMTDLRDEMQKHGLVAAMNDLEKHMAAAGITGSKVGGFITEAFGKKAGAGLSVLIQEIDRVNNKFAEGAKGGASFAAKWDATTKTTAFAFQRLGAEFESAGIKLMQSIGPNAANAANWLGTTLPKAISTLANIIGPTASMVGSVFVGAWHALSAVLSVVGGALAGIGGFLEHNRTLVTGVATAVLAMWGAYKAYQIGAAALTAIDLALGRVAMRMNRMGGAMAGVQGGIKNLSTSAVAGGAALGVIGLAMYAFSAAQSADAEISARHAAEIDSLTQAVEQDSGALGKNTRAAVENLLVKNDMYRKGAALGITQREMTDSVLGNAAALALVNAKTSVNTVQSTLLRWGLKGLNQEMKSAARNAKDKAAADQGAAGSAKNHAVATKIVASASHAAAAAEKAAADAAKRLDTALQALSGHLGTRQALDQYRQGMQQLKSNLDKTNHSLMGNSAAAVANRLAVDNVVQSALQYADALKAQGKTQPQINAALQKQVGYLLDNAKQLGLNKKELRNYLRELHLTPKQIHTLMGVDTNDARAKIRAMQQWFNSLTWTAHVSANGQDVTAGPGQTRARANASGTGTGVLPHGWAWVGDPGPHSELTHTTSRGTQVISAPQSKKIANHMGWKIPGYSGGTDPNGPPDLSGTSKSTGTKPTYSYGGVEYSSKRAADNAAARDAQSQRKDIVSGGTSAIAALRAAAHNLQSTGADLKDAAKQMRDAAAAGKVSASALDRFSNEENRLSRLGDRRDRVRNRLGTAPTRATAYDRLGTAQENYRNAHDSTASSVGAFDVTTAGTSQYGEPVTAGGILAQIRQAAAKATRFTHLLRRLIKEGLPRPLVEQLAQAGPQAYDQARALAESTPAQMRGIRSAYRSIETSGDAAGRLVANHYYKAGIDSAQALVNGMLSKESSLTKAIRHLAQKMVKELRSSLDMHSPSRLLFNEARLAFSGYENGIQSKHDDIARAAGQIGGASIPNVRHAGRSGGGHTFVTIKKQELTVQYPESGDLNTALKQLSRMTVHQMRAASQELR